MDKISLLTFAEARDMLRVGSTTLYGLLQNDMIRHYKMGGRYLIPLDAILEYLDAHRD